MAGPTLNSYADVQKYLDNLVTTLGCNIGGSPHKAFWKSLNYTSFTTGVVPGVRGNWKVLEIGNPDTSNIILALRGTAPFDGSKFQRMPADGPPYATDDQIQPLADWIKNKCPNNAPKTA